MGLLILLEDANIDLLSKFSTIQNYMWILHITPKYVYEYYTGICVRTEYYTDICIRIEYYTVICLKTCC